jgi:hypothetical protein
VDKKLHDLISDFLGKQQNYIHLVYAKPKVFCYNAFMTFRNCEINNILEQEKEFEINEKVYRVYKIQNTLIRFLSIEKENQLFELYIMI